MVTGKRPRSIRADEEDNKIRTVKRRRSICDDEEDNLIRKIFKVTLEKEDSTLENEEFDGNLDKAKRLKDLMVEVLKDRLSEQCDGNSEAEHPLPYLTGCYRRANEEEDENQIKLAMGDTSYTQCCAMNSITSQAKELVVSHSLIHLVDSVRATNSETKSYLLPLLYSKVSRGKSLDCPNGFLEQLINESDFDSLSFVLTPLYEDFRSKIMNEDLRGNFEEPLKGLTYLVTNGIELEKLSILGGFFNVSLIPDDRFYKKKERCSRRLLTRRTNIKSWFTKEIRTRTKSLHDGLEEVLLSLLRSCDTQESVFEYLAEIIRRNSSMAKLQVDPNCGSLGMFVNLSAVMIRICKNFIDKDLPNTSEIDGTYLLCDPRHLDMSDLTTLCASSKQVAACISTFQTTSSCSSTDNSTASCGKIRYTFGCEIFFMTARVLHLGLIKSLSELWRLYHKLELNANLQPTMNALLGYSPFPQPEQDMKKLLPKEAKKDWRNYCCYISQILHDKALLRDALSFYRLMVVWLVGLVGGFKMPLPSSCPIQFACMPEHLVGDAIELLIFVFLCSGLLGDVIPEMNEFIKFIIMFMASPNYIRNPYIRGRMVELLGLIIRNRRCSSSVITIFKGSELNLEFLVRDLLELYAKEVFTGSPNNLQFRESIFKILACLWEIPSHRDAWRQIAEEDTEFYLAFLNGVINENINLLDSESFLWMQERDRMFQYDKDMIGLRISYRIASLEMLAFTSKQIIVPFLLPHMVDTVVTILHTESSFGTRRFMKCGCCLEILLKQIVSIYVHLARGDSENIFVAAISKDSQSYSEHLFIDVAHLFIDVARVLDEDSLVPEFIDIGTKVNDATRKAIETEDPVILPSTKSVDRAVIQSDLPLTHEMLIPNVELKAKINKFVISKQSQ
ncbi:hypothetical protein MKW92_020908 [Papaver armeniacum]|nr:hypothetical protein MKW92_020908 [Papaver armeniacum]